MGQVALFSTPPTVSVRATEASMADLVSRIGSSGRRRHLPTLAAAIPVAAFVLGIAGPAASADETGAESRFDEHPVEFHNQGVKLAGSLLLPRSEVPVPAVVFVHGAGRQTREPYREVGEYFASQGIAALIYDKRGTGQSGGAYESYEPYENLVNDALSAIAFLKAAPRDRSITDRHLGAQSRRLHQRRRGVPIRGHSIHHCRRGRRRRRHDVLLS